MARWMVLIQAKKRRDLQHLKDHAGGGDWHIEFGPVVGRGFIRAERFERLDSAEQVHVSALALIDEISLAALSRWGGFGPIDISSIYETHPDGSRREIVMVEPACLYKEDKDQKKGSIEARMILLREYPDIMKALRYIRDEDTWDSYYRAFEAIGKSGKIVARQLVSKNECKWFTSSARGRHHEVHSPHRSPMTKAQGRVWIKNVVRRLIASLLDERLAGARVKCDTNPTKS